MEKCGTYAGWNEHQKAGTTKCGPCLKAAADYKKQWRQTTGRSRLELVPVRINQGEHE